MSVLDRLTAAPGVYWGEGTSPNGGRFVARVAVQQQADASVTLDYEAWSAEGGLQHAESTRLARTGEHVTLVATSNGGDDAMLFREGDPGVFGSTGAERVGLVLSTEAQRMTVAWWWTDRDGELREQSRAVLAPMRQIVVAPPVPGADQPAAPDDDETDRDQTDACRDDDADGDADDDADGDADGDADATPDLDAPDVAPEAAAPVIPRRRHDDPRALDPPAPQPQDATATPSDDDGLDEALQAAAAEHVAGLQDAVTSDTTVPWPGILVLHGASTGLVAQRLAARLTRAAVVRTDLFDRAVRGTAGRPDPALRHRIALSVVQGYAATGHPVILHGSSSRSDQEQLVDVIASSGLAPVQLVDVAEGEDYGEVARRLIESD